MKVNGDLKGFELWKQCELWEVFVNQFWKLKVGKLGWSNLFMKVN